MALDALEGLVEDRYGKVSPNFLKLSLLKAPESPSQWCTLTCSLPVRNLKEQAISQASQRETSAYCWPDMILWGLHRGNALTLATDL